MMVEGYDCRDQMLYFSHTSSIDDEASKSEVHDRIFL